MKKKRKKLKTLRVLKQEVWNLQSKHIRSSAANFQGMVNCYTCNALKPWQDCDLSHYIHSRLDFYLNNLRVCCVRCNRFLHGNLGIYGEKLIKEIGIKEVEKMRLYSYKKGNNYSRAELEEIKLTYQP
jgi:hypothetical protein